MAPTSTDRPRIFTTSFGSVYPLYVQKAVRKARTNEEVDEIITWLTGYRHDQPNGARTLRETADAWDYKAVSAVRRLIQEGRVEAVQVEVGPVKIIYVLTKEKPELRPPGPPPGRPRSK